MKTLKKGEKAPQFEAITDQGKTIKLADYLGKKVVLFFYPKTNTPGCTAEACNLAENYDTLNKAGYEGIGVSADSVKKQANFKEKYGFPYPLIADENKEIIEAFGVWGTKKFMGKVYDGIHRITFVIDEKGIIQRVIDKVKSKDHTAQIITT